MPTETLDQLREEMKEYKKASEPWRREYARVGEGNPTAERMAVLIIRIDMADIAIADCEKRIVERIDMLKSMSSRPYKCHDANGETSATKLALVADCKSELARYSAAMKGEKQ